jgi:hypothetical protein
LVAPDRPVLIIRTLKVHDRITNRFASWRQKPVTDYPKMLKKLRWMHITVTPGMTAGHASDLIGQVELRKRLQTIAEVNHG